MTALIAAFLAFLPPFYQFTPYDSHAELDEKFEFLGDKVEVWVILEDGKSAPTFRQRWLIKKMLRYPAELKNSMCDAADQHRKDTEHSAGDLTLEYGLPRMNRYNIQEHFGIGVIWVPQLDGLSDDYLVLACDCTWEEEHGMHLIVKNGETVACRGEVDGQSAQKFLNAVN